MTATQKRREKVLEFITNWGPRGVSQVDFSRCFTFGNRLTESALKRLEKDGQIVVVNYRYIATGVAQ